MTPQVVMLQTAARPLYVLILFAAGWVLLRGHNEPGGGFIAALVATSATVLWAVAQGAEAATRRLPGRSPVALGAAGVLLAGAAGVPAWWHGEPFLTQLWTTVDLGFTQLPLSTVLVFDLGVFLAVWGALAGYALALLDLDEPRSDAEGAAHAASRVEPAADARREELT